MLNQARFDEFLFQIKRSSSMYLCNTAWTTHTLQRETKKQWYFVYDNALLLDFQESGIGL